MPWLHTLRSPAFAMMGCSWLPEASPPKSLVDLAGSEPTNPILDFRLPGFICWDRSDPRHLMNLIDYFSAWLLGSIQQGATGEARDPTFLRQICFCNSTCNRHITPAVSDLYPSGAMAIFWICRADCCTKGRMSSTKLQPFHQVNGQRAHSSPKSWCQDTPTESFHVLPRQKLPIAWTVSPLPFAGLFLQNLWFVDLGLHVPLS